MKRLLPFLFLAGMCTVFSGCSSDKDNDPVPEPEYMYGSHFEVGNQTVLYGCRMPDVTGFERHPLIENIKFWEDQTIQIDDQTRIEINNSEIVLIARTEESFEKGTALMNKIRLQGSTVGEIYSIYGGYGEKYLLAGIKNKKLWVGEFDRLNLFELSEEWTGEKEISRNLHVHLGYGEYKDHYVHSVHGELHMVQGNENRRFVYLSYATSGDENTREYGHYGLFSLEDKIYPIDLKTEAHAGINQIITWYDESVVIYLQTGDYVLVKPDRETEIYQEFQSWQDKYPVSYTEYFTFYMYGVPQVSFYELGAPYELASVTLTEFGDIWENNMKYEIHLVNESNGIYEFRIDIIYYSGEKKTYSFKVDKECNLYE